MSKSKDNLVLSLHALFAQNLIGVEESVGEVFTHIIDEDCEPLDSSLFDFHGKLIQNQAG